MMRAASYRPAQAGIILIMALVLLLIATLLGVSGIRNVLLQEKISGNNYDQSMALQATESALRAAEAKIESNPDITALNGQSCLAPTLCPISPPDDAPTGWTDIDAAYLVNTALLEGKPQYFIQLMSETNSDDESGISGSALANQYGGSGGIVSRTYRITARSHAPDAATGRAAVRLQTTVKVDR
ncbi:hypothetical protein HQN60_10430 [Deefgea piscis]|uniref:Type 4 fimbrial biogenesis protein PilX N-terminal domain-containing protein n=1 Tax=Deefgea piscis TaxID=2739061 RepID=A0A6M8SSM4_9NEIS|nr:PilX N-terminal domain-containing pilus assembly protein [Deefgea piscis]QKJ67078.1 hypothetical protein HQN60_10430 [Deefgea piscis]